LPGRIRGEDFAVGDLQLARAAGDLGDPPAIAVAALGLRIPRTGVLRKRILRLLPASPAPAKHPCSFPALPLPERVAGPMPDLTPSPPAQCPRERLRLEPRFVLARAPVFVMQP